MCVCGGGGGGVTQGGRRNGLGGWGGCGDLIDMVSLKVGILVLYHRQQNKLVTEQLQKTGPLSTVWILLLIGLLVDVRMRNCCCLSCLDLVAMWLVDSTVAFSV